MVNLDRLLRPRSVAVIGASTDPGKVGGRPLHFLKKHGFVGDIWPVNPRAREIEGLPCYHSIDGLPGVPDTAIILVGPKDAVSAVETLAERGCGTAIVLAGGFAETGDAGYYRQQTLLKAAGDMRLLGPNTIGLLNVTNGITLSASGALDVEDLRRGGMAVVSQSGGILGSLLSRAAARGIGLSHLVATGNEADLDVADIMGYLAEDEETEVVALYLETIRNPVTFRCAAAQLSDSGKKLVVYKVGRSKTGADAAASHTGALAGEDRVFDAFFRQAHAIRVERYTDLVDVPAGLALSPSVRGNRLAVVTHTGGAAGLIADVCGTIGFETPQPSPETTEKLAKLLRDDGFAPNRNPIDLTLAGLDPEIVYRAIMILSGSGEYDAIVPVIGSSSVSRPYMVADPVIRAAATEQVPMLVYSSPHAPEIVASLNGKGVPAFDTPEACSLVLGALRNEGKPAAGRSPVVLAPDAASIISGKLNEFEAKRVFEGFGIPSAKEIVADTVAKAIEAADELGYPVVVKLLSRDVFHKTEIGCVRTNVSRSEIGDTCQDISESARNHGVTVTEGFLIQEQILGATEMILGFRRDQALGPAVIIGAGGTLTEIYQDFALSILPVTETDIRIMIKSLKIYPLLQGYRGADGADIDALVESVARFANMCQTLGDRLTEAEINPLFVGGGDIPVCAADGVLMLADC